jgi:hypothetical protein
LTRLADSLTLVGTNNAQEQPAMTQQFEIRHRWTNAVLYTGGGESLRDVVVQAVKAGANLADAYLADAYLAGANLADANLARANLARANLADAYLAGANLADAYLADAYLAGANLADANLARANLARANLADAYLAGANLARANLADAYLADANLARANLARAYLAGAKIGTDLVLVGERPVLQIDPIGSRCALLSAYLTDRGVYVRAGCFFNTLDAFRAACIETHGDSVHGREYAAAIALIEAHAGLWTPPAEESAKEAA